MKKIFVLILLLSAFSINSVYGQSGYGKISEMIKAAQRISGMLSGMLGDGKMPDNTETVSLIGINFPNSVKVKYLGEVQKTDKPRKKAVDKWLKDYAEKGADKKFYVNEIQVEENGIKYRVTAHENNVIDKLKADAKVNDEVILKMKILGFYKKGNTTEYILLADGTE